MNLWYEYLRCEKKELIAHNTRSHWSRLYHCLDNALPGKTETFPVSHKHKSAKVKKSNKSRIKIKLDDFRWAWLCAVASAMVLAVWDTCRFIQRQYDETRETVWETLREKIVIRHTVWYWSTYFVVIYFSHLKVFLFRKTYLFSGNAELYRSGYNELSLFLPPSGSLSLLCGKLHDAPCNQHQF